MKKCIILNENSYNQNLFEEIDSRINSRVFGISSNDNCRILIINIRKNVLEDFSRIPFALTTRNRLK